MAYAPRFAVISPEEMSLLTQRAAMQLGVSTALPYSAWHNPAYQQIPSLSPNLYSAQSPMYRYAAQWQACSALPTMCCYTNPMLPAMPHNANCRNGVSAYYVTTTPSAMNSDHLTENLEKFIEEFLVRDLELDEYLSRKLVIDFRIKSTLHFLLLNETMVDDMQYEKDEKDKIKSAIQKARELKEFKLIDPEDFTNKWEKFIQNFLVRDLRLNENLSRKLAIYFGIKSPSDFYLLTKTTVDDMQYDVFEKDEIKRAITRAIILKNEKLV